MSRQQNKAQEGNQANDHQKFEEREGGPPGRRTVILEQPLKRAGRSRD
jgi:hypothetical protein